MKNSNDLQNSECNEIPLTEEKKNQRLFRMISPSGFFNIFQEDFNDAERSGKHLTHERAFEIINKEYNVFTGKARYKNFQSFKKSNPVMFDKMKNSNDLQNLNCDDITSTEQQQYQRLYQMILPSGFLNIIRENIKDAEGSEKHLTFKQAFEIINQEYFSFFRMLRYKNFKSFKKSNPNLFDKIEN